MRQYDLDRPPSVEQYFQALRHLEDEGKSSGDTEDGHFQWEMYTELAQAVEQLGIVETTVI